MAKPAESKEESQLAGIESDAGTFPSAATADCGKKRTANALPDGTEFLSEAGG